MSLVKGTIGFKTSMQWKIRRDSFKKSRTFAGVALIKPFLID